MNRENVSMAIGLVLLVLGLVILFFVFFQALTIVQAPETYFEENFPELIGKEQGPTAEFSWDSNGLTVNFQDDSMEGDSSINRWEWDFDDGTTSNQQNPSHTYSNQGDYNVRLMVEDGNGERSRARADIYVEPDSNNNDVSQRDEGNGDFGLGSISHMLAVVVIVLLYFVLFLVGGAILKAGWNLVKPGPSTLKLKIRPKKVETEMEGQAYPHQGAPAYYPQQAQQGGAPPQTSQKAAKKEYPPDEEHIEKGS